MKSGCRRGLADGGEDGALHTAQEVEERMQLQVGAPLRHVQLGLAPVAGLRQLTPTKGAGAPLLELLNFKFW